MPTQVPQTITVVFDNDDIKAIPTTFPEIVSAPGVGKMLVLVNAVLAIDPSGGAYTNVEVTDLWIAYTDGSDASNYLSPIGDFFGQTTPKAIVLGPVAYPNAPINYAPPLVIEQSENKGFQIVANNNDAGNFTGGNAANTLTATVTYIILDI